MQKVINWFRKLFGRLNEIWEAFRASNAGSQVIMILNDHSIASEAMALVKTLADSNIPGAEKEAAFNQAFTTWCNNNGYDVQARIVNVIRELAYTAYTLRLEKAGA